MASKMTGNRGLLKFLGTLGAGDDMFASDAPCPRGLNDDADFSADIVAAVQEAFKAQGIEATAAAFAAAGEIAARRGQTLEKYYAIAVESVIAERNLKPNAFVGLFGDDGVCGAKYACQHEVILSQWTGGSIVGAGFTFNDEQLLHSAITQKVDIDVGWRLAQGSMKFNGDVVSGMLGDVPFAVFDERRDAGSTPLASYMYSKPNTTVAFSAIAYHNRTETQELINGVTLCLIDSSCRMNRKLFEDSMFMADYAGAVDLLMMERRAQCRRAWSKNR